MSERPTPETDAEELHEPYLVNELPFCVVRIDFARRLERQRNKAREFAKDLTDKYLEASGLLQRQLAEAREENARLREALDTLTCVIGLTPIAGNKEALQEAFDNARKLITP